MVVVSQIGVDGEPAHWKSVRHAEAVRAAKSETASAKPPTRARRPECMDDPPGLPEADKRLLGRGLAAPFFDMELDATIVAAPVVGAVVVDGLRHSETLALETLVLDAVRT